MYPGGIGIGGHIASDKRRRALPHPIQTQSGPPVWAL